MHEQFSKYFWDGGCENCSGMFMLRRIIEYASFPDLIRYPFEEFRKYLDDIDLQRLRTSRSRIEFMEYVAEKKDMVDSWEELFGLTR